MPSATGLAASAPDDLAIRRVQLLLQGRRLDAFRVSAGTADLRAAGQLTPTAIAPIELVDDGSGSADFVPMLGVRTFAIATGPTTAASVAVVPKDAPDPEAWGWRQDDGLGGHAGSWRAHGSHVGWVEDHDLYLDPSAAYAVVQAVARDVGDAISLQPRTLHKRMHEAGLLISTDHERQRLIVRKTLEGSRRAVLHLSAHFPEAAQPTHSAQTEDDHVHDGPDTWDGDAADGVTNGPDIDLEAAHPEQELPANGSAGPVGSDHDHADGIVAEMQRLLDTGALAGHCAG